MNQSEWLEELIAQIDAHGAQKVVFELETDDGYGVIIITDVKFEDGRIVVKMA